MPADIQSSGGAMVIVRVGGDGLYGNKSIYVPPGSEFDSFRAWLGTIVRGGAHRVRLGCKEISLPSRYGGGKTALLLSLGYSDKDIYAASDYEPPRDAVLYNTKVNIWDTI